MHETTAANRGGAGSRSAGGKRLAPPRADQLDGAAAAAPGDQLATLAPSPQESR